MIDVAKLRSSIDTMEQLIQHHAPNLPSKIPWVGASSFLLIEYIRVSLERRDFFFRICTIRSVDGSNITSYCVHECDASSRMGSRPRRFLITGHSNGCIQVRKRNLILQKQLASSPKKRFFTESRLIFFNFLWYLDVGPDNSTRDCLQVAWRKHRLDRFYFNN